MSSLFSRNGETENLWAESRWVYLRTRKQESKWLYASWLVAKSCLTLLWPHGLWPARLLCPWDFAGKNTGTGCHFLLQGIFPIPVLNPCKSISPALQADVYHCTTTMTVCLLTISIKGLTALPPYSASRRTAPISLLFRRKWNRLLSRMWPTKEKIPRVLITGILQHATQIIPQGGIKQHSCAQSLTLAFLTQAL